MTTYTNNNNIPLSLAVWLVHDTYDHSDDPNTISTTTLLKPIREIVLARQNRDLIKQGDISSLVASSKGTALHSAIELAWEKKSNVEAALLALGYPKGIANKILINPKKEELTNDCIPVYMEQRSIKQVGKYKISGKFDFVLEGRLEDFKSCSTYSYVMQSNADKHIQQGSIYRWLNPDIITQDTMAIQYLFSDWKKLDSIKDPKYPKSNLLEQSFNLMPIADTDTFVKKILNKIEVLEVAIQDELPECTPDELWIKPTVYKYYKDPNKTARSTKNFTTQHEASARLVKDGSVGIIKEIKGKVVKCNYCSVVNICNQAKGYVKTGQLILE